MRLCVFHDDLQRGIDAGDRDKKLYHTSLGLCTARGRAIGGCCVPVCYLQLISSAIGVNPRCCLLVEKFGRRFASDGDLFCSCHDRGFVGSATEKIGRAKNIKSETGNKQRPFYNASFYNVNARAKRCNKARKKE